VVGFCWFKFALFIGRILLTQELSGVDRIFSGNMWWARCGYINTLPPVSSLNQWMRHLAERWVGMATQACHLSCFYMDKMMYDVLISPEEYEHAPGCDALLSSDSEVSYGELHKAKVDNSSTFTSGTGSSIFLGNSVKFDIVQAQ